MKSAVEHEPGHRVLVAFATGDHDELLYLHYHCEDPTCEWGLCEFGPDECKEIANIVDNLLTDPRSSSTLESTGRRHHAAKTRDNLDLFSEGGQ